MIDFERIIFGISSADYDIHVAPFPGSPPRLWNVNTLARYVKAPTTFALSASESSGTPTHN